MAERETGDEGEEEEPQAGQVAAPPGVGLPLAAAQPAAGAEDGRGTLIIDSGMPVSRELT